MQNKRPSVGGVWIFSGTPHYRNLVFMEFYITQESLGGLKTHVHVEALMFGSHSKAFPNLHLCFVINLCGTLNTLF